jgi:hypothetical protein
MRRREFLKTGGLAAICLKLGSASIVFAAQASSYRPNILFIFVDQQQAGMIRCAGNPSVKPPAMDCLPATGTQFERVY